MTKRYLITAALLYANGKLHPGHLAGCYLPADCYARFQRLQKNDVLFISGSDEYGVAITMSAELAHKTAREHVDYYHKENQELFHRIDISFDHYSRTTNSGHIAPVQRFFLELLENGHLEKRATQQLFSPKQNRFLADRYVVGECPSCSYKEARGDECPSCGMSYEAIELRNPRSKLQDDPLTVRTTDHFYLLLDHFKSALLDFLSKKQWKTNVEHFVQEFITNLRPRAITRDMSWGVPLPISGYEDKVLYVWFDAPIGYITAAMEWALSKGSPDLWKEYWLCEETTLVQFIGKDNLPFHAAIFPAMVMGQNLPLKLVDELPANEFLNYEGKKFSKSAGWTIDLDHFLSRYGSEYLRYGLAAIAPESADSEFRWKEFQLRINSELVGKLGNFVHRVLTFIEKRENSTIPPRGMAFAEDELFEAKIAQLAIQIKGCYATFQLRRATQQLMELCQLANGYFDHKAPWKLWKEGKGDELKTTLSISLHCIKLLALASSPILPRSATKIYAMIALNESWVQSQGWDLTVQYRLPEGTLLPKPEPLFTRIEDDLIEEELRLLRGEGATKS